MIGAISPVQIGSYPVPHGGPAGHAAAPAPVSGESGIEKTAEKNAKPATPSPVNQQQLSEEERAKVRELQAVDREIRAHEQAHKSAGGQYAGSASFGYQTGPDGRRYAVSGEVPIDAAPVEGDPGATIEKMDQIISAALAPAEPSAQDRKVAAQARAAKTRAQAELSAQKAEELKARTESTAEGSDAPAGKTSPGVSAYRSADGLSRQGSDNFFSLAV